MKKTDLKNTVHVQIPTFNSSVFIASGAKIVGDVSIGNASSVWFGTVIRGDIQSISIGERSNIQDLSMIHVENDLGCHIGNDVTVGHRAILHACTIEDGVLIGMGAIILNGALIKKGAVIAAGAVVKEGVVVESNTLWAGVPARYIRTYEDNKYEENKAWAAKYVKLAMCHKKEG